MFIGDEKDERWIACNIPDPLSPHSKPINAVRHEAQGVSLLCDSPQQAEWLAETLNDRLIAPLADFDGPDDDFEVYDKSQHIAT